MHTNFRHLNYLVKVAELGSITSASVAVGISQPAISAAIKSVEDQVGYQLFIRNPSHGISLTQAGRQFVKQAKHLLNDVHNFERFASGLGEDLTGQLQIGCYSVIAPFIVPRILTAFKELYPRVSITIHETDLLQTISDLKNGFTDIAISYDFVNDESIEYELLFDVLPHVIISSTNELVKKDKVSLKDLCSMPLLLLNLSSESYFEDLFALHNLKPNISYRIRTFEMVRGLVGAGLGYSFGRLPIKVEHAYDGSLLKRKRLLEYVPAASVCLVKPLHNRPVRVVQAFIDVSHSIYEDAELENSDTI